MHKINISKTLANLDEHWSQRVVAEANGQLFKVAKGIGATNWHKHDDQDELFLIQKGSLRIEFRDSVIDLEANDIFVVPKGIEHRPVADAEVEFLIVGLNITSTKEGGKPN
ncbi:MAG: cupin domain-containing protein [Bacteroidota bacterium]